MAKPAEPPPNAKPAPARTKVTLEALEDADAFDEGAPTERMTPEQIQAALGAAAAAAPAKGKKPA